MSNLEMSEKQKDSLALLLKQIQDHKTATLYNTLIQGNSFDGIKTISWKGLVRCPLGERLYYGNKHLVKIVYRDNTPFLIARSREEIVDEPYYASESVRPFVGCTDRASGMEVGLWFYERNILPLLETGDAEVASSLARRYQADSFTGDMQSAKRLLPELAKDYDLGLLKFIHITSGTDSDIDFLSQYIALKNIYVSAYLPECGLWAYACPQQLRENRKVILHPLENVIVESFRNVLLTKISELPTPIIRFDTGLSAEIIEHNCLYDTTLSISIKNV